MTVKILIVYASDFGNTKKMAEAVAEGVLSVEETQVSIKTAEEVSIDEVTAADGLILGSPVHMGSPDWRVKKFIDTICSRLWMQDKLIGKVGGVFACGGGFGGAGGGCEITLLALLNNLVELGLIVVPLPKNTPGYAWGGLQWGPVGRSQGLNMEDKGVSTEQLTVVRHHGKHIARAAHALKKQVIFGEHYSRVS